MKILTEQKLYEMAKVGTFDSYTILVWTNDAGRIPHCDIVDTSTLGDKFSCCVRLDKPEYFIHQCKEDKLNSRQKKSFISFLNEPCRNKKFKNYTNWEILVFMWNINNSSIEVDDSQMPDYNLL